MFFCAGPVVFLFYIVFFTLFVFSPLLFHTTKPPSQETSPPSTKLSPPFLPRFFSSNNGSLALLGGFDYFVFFYFPCFGRQNPPHTMTAEKPPDQHKIPAQHPAVCKYPFPFIFP
eukprot:TRINITY_DN97229_c0_g1_i1.p1 TRINITY_DN97229_c0_g1~~TRINITY_DN97229_c0_g1_i1.p1  ORF type:complete len:133 (+),score=7.95 TRINITY_DN97229_c0_g1_i1:56-400(+)